MEKAGSFWEFEHKETPDSRIDCSGSRYTCNRLLFRLLTSDFSFGLQQIRLTGLLIPLTLKLSYSKDDYCRQTKQKKEND